MIPLKTHLDDMDFDALVALARELLPARAPEWTDYNIHDPGIMLVELLAWVADSQIYSLARHRRDERIAMARLLGIAPRGAVAARGMVEPVEPVQQHLRIETGTRLTAARAAAPLLETTAPVDLLPLRITSIRTEEPGGTVDHSQANVRPLASYAPFGAPTDPHAALVLQMEGMLPAQPLRLAIGVICEGDDAPATDLGAIALYHRDERGIERPLSDVADGTSALACSGVLLVTLTETLARQNPIIVVRPIRGEALLPRILSIAINVLPVAQTASVERTIQNWANGRPGQRLVFETAQLLEAGQVVEGANWGLVGENGPALTLETLGEGRNWSIGDPDDADPDVSVFALAEDRDNGRITLRFGNGVNGVRPRAGSALQAAMTLSCGASGNIGTVVNWAMDLHGTRWRNAAPIRGGLDPLDPEGMLEHMRGRLRDARPLATSAQIEESALALPSAFGVERAEVIEGWEPGRRKPASRRTRTLILWRKPIGDRPTESAAWLRAVRRRIAPRLAIAERLVVTTPVAVPVGIDARVAVVRSRAPDAVATAVRAEIAHRLNPQRWPVGQDLSAAMVGGWIRRVPGVARVEELRLSDAGGADWPDGLVSVQRGAVPQIAGLSISALASEVRS